MWRLEGRTRASLPLFILIVAGLWIPGVLSVDYLACGQDPTGDVCHGDWDLLGVNLRCKSLVDRPNVDILSANTSDDVSHVKFQIKVRGEASKSLKVLYGFRGTIGKGLLGIPKHITIWVLDGTAYLMTDLTRQLLPVKEPMATTMGGDWITIRIPKTDIGDCTKWEMRAFALEAKSDLSPGLMIATAYYDETRLAGCPLSELGLPFLLSALILAGLLITIFRYSRTDHGLAAEGTPHGV